LPTRPTIKAFAVSKLRFSPFHGMEEVVGSIPTRSTKQPLTNQIATRKQSPSFERQKKTEYQHVIAVASLLCGFSDLHRLSKNHIVYVVLARKVFGGEYMKVVGYRVQS
jgi:hypothetical protein